VAELKSQALQLKKAGDAAGAVAALREAKQLELEAARPAAMVAAEETQATAMAKVAAAAAAVMETVAEVERQRTQASEAEAAEAEGGGAEEGGATASTAAQSSAAANASAVAARVAELKSQALQLKKAGDAAGAVAALREAKQLELEAARPAAMVAAEETQATAMAKVAAAAAAVMETVAEVERQRTQASEAEAAEAAEAEAGEEQAEADAEAEAEAEADAEADAEAEAEAAATMAAAAAAVAAATADTKAGTPAAASPAAVAGGGDAPEDALSARIEQLRREALVAKREGRTDEALAKMREMRTLQREAAGEIADPGGAAAAPAPAAPPPPPVPLLNPDLSKTEMEVRLASAVLGGAVGSSVSCYAVFRWSLPAPGSGVAKHGFVSGAGEPVTVTTEAVPAGSRCPAWGHSGRVALGTDPRRSRSAVRHFSTGEGRSGRVEVWGAAAGMNKFLGGKDELLGAGEVKVSALVGAATASEQVALADAKGRGAGTVDVTLRVRYAIGTATEPAAAASRSASAGVRREGAGGGSRRGGGGGGAKGGAGAGGGPAVPTLSEAARAAAAMVAAEEEDDMGYASSIVSYNVLGAELEELSNMRSALEAKGAIIPTTFEGRHQALEFRQEMLQIQVDTGQLSLEAYLDQLRAAVAKEKARFAQLKVAAKEGAGALVTKAAIRANKRAQTMQQEIDEAMAAG